MSDENETNKIDQELLDEIEAPVPVYTAIMVLSSCQEGVSNKTFLVDNPTTTIIEEMFEKMKEEVIGGPVITGLALMERLSIIKEKLEADVKSIGEIVSMMETITINAWQDPASDLIGQDVTYNGKKYSVKRPETWGEDSESPYKGMIDIIIDGLGTDFPGTPWDMPKIYHFGTKGKYLSMLEENPTGPQWCENCGKVIEYKKENREFNGPFCGCKVVSPESIGTECQYCGGSIGGPTGELDENFEPIVIDGTCRCATRKPTLKQKMFYLFGKDQIKSRKVNGRL